MPTCTTIVPILVNMNTAANLSEFYFVTIVTILDYRWPSYSAPIDHIRVHILLLGNKILNFSEHMIT